MKRLHVHVSVKDLDESIRFYATLFGAEPDVRESDYAKWMLDDPRVNFAVSYRDGRASGVNHLGIQVDDDRELSEVANRLAEAEHPVITQSDAACCYARSDKAWAADPQGVTWETFHSHGGIAVFGEDRIDRSRLTPANETAGCCGEPSQAAK
jgi:catechol 2,3-dioxygenase-like lactoylglutathione lyase family enzyme